MPCRWRLIETEPADGFTNMAFDEAILRGYIAGGSPPTLRIYGWRPEAISLGYSQDASRDLDLEFCHRAGLAFVRRITGGGMIRHKDELTYSLACSKEDLGIPAHVPSSYRVVSSFLIEFYKRLGLDAKFACDDAPGEKFGMPSALCFASKEKYDIVVGGRKIGGSAQKRSRGAIFQHGSIPIAPHPQAASLSELLVPPVSGAELSALLVESFKNTFGVELEPGGLSAREEKLFRDLKALKYERDEWNFDRVDATMVRDEDEAALVAQ